MDNKKRNIVLTLIVLLAIGFASVSSVLVINGLLAIGENSDDFKIIFTSASIDGTQRNDVISESKTEISYETKVLSLIDEESTLNYEATNTSRNYDADVNIVCNIVDESENIIEGENEYVGVTYTPESMELLAGETKSGSITAKLKKTVIEPMDISIKCTLTATPKERTELGTTTTKITTTTTTTTTQPIECIPNEYVKGEWKYLDNDCSGDLTKNDLITLDTESFYVYDIRGDNVKAISEYNVDTTTGLQSTTAGTVAYSVNNSGVYETSEIKGYVDSYKTKLEELNGNIIEARLITKEELDDVGCDSSKYTCKSAPSYITSTSYWSMSPNPNTYTVWCMGTYGSFKTGSFSDNIYYGVRPVIEVSKLLIDGKEGVKGTSWKLTEDNDNSGEVSKGDLITLGSESFYIYDIEGDNVKTISQYNLYVGNMMDSHYTTTPLKNPTGFQDPRAIGAPRVSSASFPWIGVIAYDSKDSNVYETSEIKGYVDAYKTKLEELNENIIEARLITKEELDKVGCDLSNLTCKSAPAYITSTSYWTMSLRDNYENQVWVLRTDYAFGGMAARSIFYYGVRPVIELSKSLFD